MAIVQTTAKLQSNGVAAPTITYNAATAFKAGNSAVFSLVHYGSNTTDRITGITIGGTAATKCIDANDAAVLNHAELWAVTNMAGGTTAVVLTIAGVATGHFVTGVVQERDDLLTTSYLDRTGVASPATNSAAPTVSASANTTQARDLLYGVFCDTVGTNWTSSTPPSGYTEIWEEPNGATVEAGSAAFKITTAIGAQTLVFATGASMSWVAAMAALKLGPFMNAHGLSYDFINAGGATITTPAMDTTGGAGIMLALMGRGIIADFATATVSDNQSNGNYSQVGTSHAYTAFPSSGTAVFQKTNPNGGASHTVNASKPSPNDEVTLFAVHIANVDTIVDQKWNEDLTTATNTSLSVTTTGQATLVAFWAGADSNGELNPAAPAGWTVIDHTSSLASNHVQGAVAVRNVAAAGTYSIVWTPSTPQGAQLWLLALQLTGSGPPAVTASVAWLKA